jgi:hypothetical protein
VLPDAWHDEWRAIPDLVHLVLAILALAAVAGAAGEVLD